MIEVTKPFLDEFFKRTLLKKDGQPLKANGKSVYKSCWKVHLLPTLSSRPFDDIDSFSTRFFTSTRDTNKSRESEDKYNAVMALYRNLTWAEKTDLVEDVDRLEVILKSIQSEVMAESVLRLQQSGKPNKNMTRIGNVDWDALVEDVLAYTTYVLGKQKPTREDLMTAIIVNLYVTCNAPRRREYANLAVTDEDPLNDNTYYDGTILLRNYKTALAYGPYSFRVNPSTKALFDLLIPKLGGRYIFYPDNTTESQRLERWTKRVEDAFKIVCKKPLHCTDLRKYFFSHKMRKKTLYNEDLWKIAAEMGTSRQKLMGNYGVPLII